MSPLVALGVITLVFNLGGGLIAPALPLYARSLGADYRDLGLIGAAHGLAFAALTIPLGRASDRLGRQALLLASALAVGLAAACYLVADGVPGLVAGKLLEAAGWAGFWPALEAWVAGAFGRRAGTAMGVGYGAYAAAYVVGSSGAGFVIEALGLRAPFALYLAITGVAAALVLAMPRGDRDAPDAGLDAPHPGSRSEGDGQRGDRRSANSQLGASRLGQGQTGTSPLDTRQPAHGPLGEGRLEESPPGSSQPRDRRLDRRQRGLAYATGFVYVFGLGTVLAFLPAYGADRGLPPRWVGLLLASYWVARAVASLGAGQWSDRVGRRAVLLPALGLAAGGAVLVGLPSGMVGLFAGTLALGLAAGACAPTCVGLIADHVAPRDRGMAMGLFEAACGVSMMLAGFVGGEAAARLGPGVPYLLVAALSLGWGLVLTRHGPAPTRGRWG